MKTGLPLLVAVCLLVPLAGCSDTPTSDKSSIYYKHVPDALQSKLDTGMKKLSQSRPLAPAAKEKVRQTIAGMDTKEVSKRNDSFIQVLSVLGSPALPIIAQSLTSPDDATRLKAVLALPALERVRPLHTRDYLSTTEPLVILLSHRSLYDRNPKVRFNAFGALFRIGESHMPKDVPQEVFAALEVAAKDPDEEIRQNAQNAIDYLSGKPVRPMRETP